MFVLLFFALRCLKTKRIEGATPRASMCVVSLNGRCKTVHLEQLHLQVSEARWGGGDRHRRHPMAVELCLCFILLDDVRLCLTCGARRQVPRYSINFVVRAAPSRFSFLQLAMVRRRRRRRQATAKHNISSLMKANRSKISSQPCRARTARRPARRRPRRPAARPRRRGRAGPATSAGGRA